MSSSIEALTEAGIHFITRSYIFSVACIFLLSVDRLTRKVFNWSNTLLSKVIARHYYYRWQDLRSMVLVNYLDRVMLPEL